MAVTRGHGEVRGAGDRRRGGPPRLPGHVLQPPARRPGAAQDGRHRLRDLDRPGAPGRADHRQDQGGGHPPRRRPPGLRRRRGRRAADRPDHPLPRRHRRDGPAGPVRADQDAVATASWRCCARRRRPSTWSRCSRTCRCRRPPTRSPSSPRPACRSARSSSTWPPSRCCRPTASPAPPAAVWPAPTSRAALAAAHLPGDGALRRCPGRGGRRARPRWAPQDALRGRRRGARPADRRAAAAAGPDRPRRAVRAGRPARGRRPARCARCAA